MREKRLTISILTLVESIVVEETKEWPSRLGTIYRNQNDKGKWTEYKLTEYKLLTQF